METPGDTTLFERYARAYDRLMPTTDERALRAGLALAERDIERVVDIGGGSGRAVRALDAPERLVVDATAGMLEVAREHGMECVRGDGATLPLASESADAVLVVDALHHMADQVSVLEEAVRVLRPGGVLVIREFDRATVLGGLLVVGERLLGFDSQFFTPEELRTRVENAGLRAAVPSHGFEFTVVGRKEPADAE